MIIEWHHIRGVPSKNYIGRQLGVSYIGRQCTEKLSIYQNLTSDISRPTHRLPKYVNYVRPISLERTGSEPEKEVSRVFSLGYGGHAFA